MPDTIYIYENHKITGPDGYNVNIITSDQGKDINIEGTDNIILKWEDKKYTISNNFIDKGYIKRNSVMDYNGNIFVIPKDYIKNYGIIKLSFPIYSNNKEIAYISKLKNSLSITIERKEYIIPVIIYIAVISTKLKETFGRLHMKTGNTGIIQPIFYALLVIFSITGFEINSFLLTILSLFFMTSTSILSLALRKNNIF